MSIERPFGGAPSDVRLAVDIARVRHGVLENPQFGLETARIDALPHQLIAVYDRMLKEPQLRFLLADDPGAGKTIMAGLYIREMRHRNLINRALIVAPAGLVGNWRSELARLFSLEARIVSGKDVQKGVNPFASADSDLCIVSVDFLANTKVLRLLADPAVAPYDLAVFDEAHKLSARIDQQLYVTRTVRYRAAEALAGAESDQEGWSLPWHPRHFLLMSATPHMGKDDPYYFLWRLLDPTVLPTREAFDAMPPEQRGRRYLRRTKEELVDFDGGPLFVTRKSNTLDFPLTQGQGGERALYDAVTRYLENDYARAPILNSEAAKLAKGVYQRRLASSTLAVLRSLERRATGLERLVEQYKRYRRTGAAAPASAAARSEPVPEDADIGDEERDDDSIKDSQFVRLPDGVTPEQVVHDLKAEATIVRGLVEQARGVDHRGDESKFQKLMELVNDREYALEKLIVFTEFRDTAEFLRKRLEANGWASRIAQIDGSMDYRSREAAVEQFRSDHVHRGGARFLVATDAAGEGINLQFCWLTVNYDLPWNPARLEQRMGRTHRYGQTHNPVMIVNLVASETREGRVFSVLLDKLEAIRQQLGSDKVFDVIGRLFAGISLSEYLAAGRDIDDHVLEQLGGQLTAEQVAALEAQEHARLGVSPDSVIGQLERLRVERRRQQWRRVLPGTLRQIVERGAPRAGLAVKGDLSGTFELQAPLPFSMAAVIAPVPQEDRARLAFGTPGTKPRGDSTRWVHPGEPLGDALLATISDAVAPGAMAGTVLIDPHATDPKVVVFAEVELAQQRDGTTVLAPAGAWLMAAVADATGVRSVEIDDMQRWVDARDPVPASALLDYGANARDWCDQATAWVTGTVATGKLEATRNRVRVGIPGRLKQVNDGYDAEAAELSKRRTMLQERAEADPKAQIALRAVLHMQKSWEARRQKALTAVNESPLRYVMGRTGVFATALVVPPPHTASAGSGETQEVETAAVEYARLYEEQNGGEVTDVSTPELARAAGLVDWPGFDLVSRRGGEDRYIEVKGRSQIGEVVMSWNEWESAFTHRGKYWLYVVFHATASAPTFHPINDPANRLHPRTRTFSIAANDIIAASDV